MKLAVRHDLNACLARHKQAYLRDHIGGPAQDEVDEQATDSHHEEHEGDEVASVDHVGRAEEVHDVR